MDQLPDICPHLLDVVTLLEKLYRALLSFRKSVCKTLFARFNAPVFGIGIAEKHNIVSSSLAQMIHRLFYAAVDFQDDL